MGLHQIFNCIELMRIEEVNRCEDGTIEGPLLCSCCFKFYLSIDPSFLP